jgi:hypothetical protein
MKRLLLITALSLTICSCSSENKNKDNMGFFDKLFGRKSSKNKTENQTTKIDKTSQIYIEYQNKLLQTKQFYPFDRWRESYNDGLTQYTKQNCDKIKNVFNDLIISLIDLGENGREAQKKELFKTAIIKTNKLNDEIEYPLLVDLTQINMEMAKDWRVNGENGKKNYC